VSKFPHVLVHHPQPYDIVDSPVAISGIGAAFEGVIGRATVIDHDGNGIGDSLVQGGGMSFGNFEAVIQLTAAPQGGPLATLRIEPEDPAGVGVPAVEVPMALGPTLIAGYMGFAVHKVVTGDTLTKTAQTYYGANDPTAINRIFNANRDVVSNPNLIYVGTELRIPVN
jgi:nucleoid-associated protein YgaU